MISKGVRLQERGETVTMSERRSRTIQIDQWTAARKWLREPIEPCRYKAFQQVGTAGTLVGVTFPCQIGRSVVILQSFHVSGELRGKQGHSSRCNPVDSAVLTRCSFCFRGSCKLLWVEKDDVLDRLKILRQLEQSRGVPCMGCMYGDWKTQL